MLTLWSRREWAVRGFVFVGMLGFVVLVYVLVVLGAGALLDKDSTEPDLALSVVATAVVALGFDRVQTRVTERVTRTVYGGQTSPFEVLRQLSGTVAGSYHAEEVPERMARLLAQGTGGEWAQVWLIVGGRPVLAGTWPREEQAVAPEPESARQPPLEGRGLSAREVWHRGHLLGHLAVKSRPGSTLTATEQRLFDGLAHQAQLVLHQASLRAELAAQAAALSARVDELTVSRQRMVDAQDEGRRALERDIHDGAQQHLVALAVNLRVAQALASTAPDRAASIIDAQAAAARTAERTLVELAQGIYPTLLTQAGPADALRAAAQASPLPVTVTSSDLSRLHPDVEAATYFCCLEALQNAVKHAGASAVWVDLRGGVAGELELQFEVTDDGKGFEVEGAVTGSGLTNMRDRIESVGGSLTVTSTSAGSRVVGSFPRRGA